MTFTDPTYLRTIRDGLLSGSVHKDNASALPMGLVGMYEEALPAAVNVNERKKFLEFFSIWAMLKKEVSEEFVLPLLKGWTEEQVIDYIAHYSKCFNSPVSGKYVLYHERLRTFILQKVSAHHFEKCNEQIIRQCQLALQAKVGDEWERYALEYLSTHLLIQAMESRDNQALKALSYNTAHWNRQIEISKGFEWSKRMLNEMMLWASKYDDNEVIESALNKVDLHHLEQNDAPRIVELVAQNDIDTALQRIDSFGGNDKEGLQRKFILYMLCLMELTLLDSKDKPFRKEAIEKLLKHLDDNLPVDHSVLNWNDFFPSYLMFLMACEWAEMSLNYLIVYKRTEDWEKAWIEEKGPYTNLQLEVLLECVSVISNELDKKSTALKDISTQLAKQWKTEEALACARGISGELDRSSALKHISTELAKQGKVDDALACARGISNDRAKSSALKDISTELATQSKLELAKSVMQEALACARGISHDIWNSSVMKDISAELAKQGKVDEALECARGISKDYYRISALNAINTEMAKKSKLYDALAYASDISDETDRSCALKDIAAELANQGMIEDAISAMKEAFACALRITDESEKCNTLKDISSALDKLGKAEEAASAMQEALTCARGISYESHKCSALTAISSELVKQDKVDESASAMQEALTCARGISHAIWKSSALMEISTELSKQGKVDESFACARGISDDTWKSRALKNISSEMAKQAKINDARSSMHEALAYARGIRDYRKSSTLNAIAIQLIIEGRLDEALACTREIRDKSKKIRMLKDIMDESKKSRVLTVISTELAKQGKIDEAASAMQEALACARSIDDTWKSRCLKDISTEMDKQGRVDEATKVLHEALACARGIRYESHKCSALSAISTELAKQAKINEAVLVMQEALACARGISYESDKSKALKDISVELGKQGEIDEALACARSINEDYWKSSALTAISTELAKLGKPKEAASATQESLACARGINDYYRKSSTLTAISIVLAKQGKIDEAASAMQEALAFARSIGDETEKSSTLKDISAELARQGNWSLAQSTALEIPHLAERRRCWKEIAETTCTELGLQSALKYEKRIQHIELKADYLKGLADSAKASEVRKEQFLTARSFFLNDLESEEKLLQQYALHELFFNEDPENRMERLSRTLNIHWALDIVAQFPKEESGLTRSSNNINKWLHEIADEDDRDQIELWAKQVAKGKITEGEFRERVGGLV